MFLINEDECELVSGSYAYGTDTTPWLGLAAGGVSVTWATTSAVTGGALLAPVVVGVGELAGPVLFGVGVYGAMTVAMQTYGGEQFTSAIANGISSAVNAISDAFSMTYGGSSNNFHSPGAPTNW